MTHQNTIDHSRITCYLRNYDTIKQYFCLLPYNDTSRPIIAPQEYLIHFDDFLLPCKVPKIIKKPLTVNKHLVSAPLNDKEKSYSTAVSKQAYSYNELLFIFVKVILFVVKATKAKSETQYTALEHYTPKQPTTTTDKLFAISLTILIHTKRILRILHLQHSHTFSNDTTIIRY